MDLIDTIVRLAWLIGAAGFIFGLMRMNSPATARNGNIISAAGMALAILVGFAVISKVPATLHTPLMSGANSIHGIVLVGAMLIAAEASGGVSQLISLVAVAFAAMNVVGGYVVTDRMLQMFRKKPTVPKPAADDAEAAS